VCSDGWEDEAKDGNNFLLVKGIKGLDFFYTDTDIRNAVPEK